MKKIYTLSLILFSCFSSFAQVFYSEDFGTPTGTTLFPAYTTGTAPATFQNAAPITYTGSADVRKTTASSGYLGASGNGQAYIGVASAIGKFMQIDGLNTSAYNSADLVLSFGYLTGVTPATSQVILEQSTDGTNWTPIVYTPNAGTAWTLVTVSGGIEASATLSLRFTNPGGSAQIRIDDIVLSNGAIAPPLCTLLFGSPTTVCDAITAGVDTYTATIPFTGGGTATYTLGANAGTVGGDNPSTSATGNITITGANEGTALVFTATGGDCNLTVNVISPSCTPPPVGVALPYYNPFDYAVDTTLGTQSGWANVNTGDDILATSGNLSYAGYPEVGNSVSFAGVGIDTFLSTTEVTTGMVYYSFLMNVGSMAGVTEPNGGYFAGLASSTTTYGGTLWTKRVDDNTFNLGIEVRTATATNTTWTPDNYTTGTTYFVVVGYMLGANLSDDAVSLWVNPVVDAAEPTPTITDTHTATDLTLVNRFFFRQDTATETPSLQIDALRIGTTWADVTSATLGIKTNEIAGLNIYPNPVTNGTLFIDTKLNGDKNISIYNVLGKEVLNTTTASNAVNVSKLSAGVYIVKVIENGNSATRKLVIR